MRPVLRVISNSPSRAQDGPQAIDRALAKAVSKGQRDAIATLTRRCLPVVHAVACRLLKDPVEAEDVAQETFLKVWRSIHQYDAERARLEAWTAKIAANACYDRLRKRAEVLVDHDLPDRPDARPLADEVMAAKGSAERVRSAINALPPRQAAALELCALREHTNIEAAEILDVSVEALESLLSRARRTLKAMLTEDRNALLEGLSKGHGGEA
jgi:RNA polymerase sigma-70 factor (ECF subfamily)